MEGIYITSENLENTAAQVQTMKVQMEGIFDQMRQTIRGMNAFWDSPAARALRISSSSWLRFFLSTSL